MSSASETSSQVRQFGLYRTIDARTEEFLKLSRKRQIKQGCACAAISTIITVAVVIIVILIYEYSTLVPDSTTKAAFNQNWLGLMNTTLDGLPIEVKINKAKLSLNPATIQILPLILKALKKNNYFNKIIEDPSSSTPKYDNKEEVEEVITKSIFSDARNWMRMPVSRLYAIEYRTSPIVYPTRNIDYYTKIRKIRDYQRVMNYVDKMISEKVPLGTTVPMKNIYTSYKKPIFEYTTPMTKVEIRNISIQNAVTATDISTSPRPDVHTVCNCPKRMSDLFSKFIIKLKSILPDLTNELKTPKPCNHNQGERTEIKKSVYFNNVGEPPKELGVNNISDDEVLKYNSSLLISRTQFKNKGGKNNDKPTQSEESTFNFMKKIPRNNTHSMQTEKTEFLHNTAAEKQQSSSINHIETPDQTALSKYSYVTTVKDYIIQKSTNLSKESLFYSIFPEKNIEDHKDTTPNILDYFKILDAHSLELVKSKIVSNRTKLNKFGKKDRFNISAIDYSIFSKINVSTDNLLNIGSTYDATTSTLTTDTTTSSYFNRNSNCSTALFNNSEEEKMLHNITTRYTIRPNDLHLEEDIEKDSVDYTEAGIKNIEDEISKTKNTSNYNNKNITEGSEYEWEIVKVVEDNFKDHNHQKSMIPQSRSSYLEIQRGEWRNDENQDYDNNINNYLLDLK